MRNREMLLLLLIVGMVLLGGCTAKQGQTGTIDTNAAAGNPAGQNNSGGAQDGNALTEKQMAEQKAILEIAGKLDACIALADDIKRETCLVALAKSAKIDYPCTKIELISKDRCYGEVAKAANDDATCTKISNVFLANQCHASVAASARNISACFKITDEIFRDECAKGIAESDKSGVECGLIYDPAKRNDCYINVAGSTNDNSFCEKIGTRKDSKGFERDRCYFAAQDPPKGEHCFFLLDDELRRECFLSAPNTADANVSCEGIADETSKNNCLFWVGTTRLEVSVCKELPYFQANECIDKLLEGNPGVEQCALLKGIDLINSCYHKAALDTNSDAVCAKISGKPPLEDTCYMDLAVKKSDGEICKNMRLNNFSGRDSCFSEIAVKNKDYAVCEYVTIDTGYYTCFAQVAASLDVPEICEKAKRTRLKVLPYPPSLYCYEEYAVQKEDPVACSFIKVPNERNQCYFDYALQTGDGSVCVSIADDRNKMLECRKAAG